MVKSGTRHVPNGLSFSRNMNRARYFHGERRPCYRISPSPMRVILSSLNGDRRRGGGRRGEGFTRKERFMSRLWYEYGRASRPSFCRLNSKFRIFRIACFRMNFSFLFFKLSSRGCLFKVVTMGKEGRKIFPF